MWNRERLVIAGALAAVLALAACSSPEAQEGGPIKPSNEHGSSGAIVDAGEPFTDAFELIEVEPGKSATIQSVELLGATPGFRLLDAKLAGPDRQSMIVYQFEPTFPPTEAGLGSLVPAVGAEIDGDHAGTPGYELILKLQVDREGRFSREGIRVNYTSDGVAYQRSIVAVLGVCTQKGLDAQGLCPALD